MRTTKLSSIFLMAMILFISCSSDDTKEVEKVKETLENTVWEKTEDGLISRISFYKSDCIYLIKSVEFESISTSSSYTYEYNEPHAIMKPNDAGNAILKAEVFKTYLVLTNTSNNKVIATLMKK